MDLACAYTNNISQHACTYVRIYHVYTSTYRHFVTQCVHQHCLNLGAHVTRHEHACTMNNADARMNNTSTDGIMVVRYEIYMISQDRFVTTERHRLLHVHQASG